VLKGSGIPVVALWTWSADSPVKSPTSRGVRQGCDKDIIAYLKDHNLLVKRENYLHSYPFCYRTKKPLIYRAMSCWFVDINKIKQYMLSSNDQITWMPEHLKYGRFGKWLEGARDWAITATVSGKSDSCLEVRRQRPDRSHRSVAELEAKCGKKVDDLHKHFVDDLTWPSPDGKGTMRRIGDVLDCWLNRVQCLCPTALSV
jgi:isoleucyl-tRNA synthetase